MSKRNIRDSDVTKKHVDCTGFLKDKTPAILKMMISHFWLTLCFDLYHTNYLISWLEKIKKLS